MSTLLEQMKTYEIDDVANAYQKAFEDELDRECLIPWAQFTGNKMALKYISVSREYSQKEGIMNRFNLSLQVADSLRSHITKTLPFRRRFLDLFYLADEAFSFLAYDEQKGQLSEKTIS